MQRKSAQPERTSTDDFYTVRVTITLQIVVLAFTSVYEILEYDSIQMKAVLSCGAAYYAGQSGSNF